LEAAGLVATTTGAADLRTLFAKHAHQFGPFGGNTTTTTKGHFYSQKVTIPPVLWPQFADMVGSGCAEQGGEGKSRGYCQYGHVMDRCWRAYYTSFCLKCLGAGGSGLSVSAEFRDERRAEFLVTVWPRWQAIKEWLQKEG
jgi:hypothetical protein